MSLSTSFFSGELRMASAIRPLYVCEGFSYNLARELPEDREKPQLPKESTVGQKLVYSNGVTAGGGGGP